MLLERVQVRNVRLYTSAVLPCKPGLNLLWGPNGSGKTTLLEAICVGAWGKAFDTPDALLVQRGAPQYWIRLEACSDVGVPYWVEVEYSLDHGKRIRSSHRSSLTPKELIGILPVVFLGPALRAITTGPPHERRRFLDVVLSQCSRPYLETLLEHRRTLRQRNALLQHYQAEAHFLPQWQSWTELFIELSAQLIWRRWQFIREFEPLIQEHYRRIAPTESLQVRYVPDSVPPECADQGPGAISSCLSRRAAELEAEELRRGTTLFGPQKDDVLFLLNGMLARETASQGQHKSLLLSLKLAELLYLRHHHGETPIMLLDDVFGELDEIRAHAALSLLQAYGVQTFITATDPLHLPAQLHQKAHCIRIEAGSLLQSS